MRIYVAADIHGRFHLIKDFCRKKKTTKEDLLIHLGDLQVNYDGYVYDQEKKEYLESLPIRILNVRGNHEMRPEQCPGYVLTRWNEGKVYIENAYPSLLFAKDGEIYNFNGLRAIAIGGACSIDRQRRVAAGRGWWRDEQLSKKERKEIEQKLEKNGWQVDVVLSHTAPLKYEPCEAFLPGVKQYLVDKTMETWLDSIEERLDYQYWFCGHYHVQKSLDKMQYVFCNPIDFPEKEPCGGKE